MKFSSFSKLFGSAWRGKNRNKRGTKPVPARRVHLRLEALEDRTVMSSTNILPAPLVTNPTALTTNFPLPVGTATQSFDPQVAVDPLNHLKMVEVNVALNNTTNPAQFGTYILDGNYSTDGGKTWNALNLPGSNNPDPNTGAPGDSRGIRSFDVAQTPSISFDRAEQFYIVSDQHSSDFTSGAIVLEKFDFSSFAPSQVLLTPQATWTLAAPVNPGNTTLTVNAGPTPPTTPFTATIGNESLTISSTSGTNNTLWTIQGSATASHASGATVSVTAGTPQNDLSDPSDIARGTNILYRWYSPTAQDAAYNPVVAVDSNLPTYTDPTTGQTQTDTMANMLAPDSSNPTALFPKAVYVAWNTNFTEPQGSSPATLSRIMLDASADGGTSFSTVQNVSTDSLDAAAPQIVFTQGTALPKNPGTVAVSGGQLTFVWSKRPIPGVNPPDAHVVGSQQDGGVATAPVTATQDFTGAGGGIANALASNTTLTWTLATQVNVGDKTLTVNPGPTPPGGTFNVTIDSETLTIIGTSGNLWTIQGGATVAHVAGSAVTYKTTSNNSTPVTSKYFIPVAINPNSNLTTVNDYDVTLNLTYPNLQQISIVLVPPKGSGLAPITLVDNHLDSAGNSRGNTGISGANMGNLQTDPNNYSSAQNGHQAGTVFDDQAERNIADPTASAPFVGHFRPEYGLLLPGTLTWTLAAKVNPGDTTLTVNPGPTPPSSPFSVTIGGETLFITGTSGNVWTIGNGGATTSHAAASPVIYGPIAASLLNGQWELDITNFIHDSSNPIPPKYLTDWSLHFTGVIGTVAFNAATDKLLTLGTAAFSPTNVYSTTGNAFGTPGVGPGLVMAVDNTLGGLSPYQGRLYLAYTGAGGSSVFLVSSDDGGAHWGVPKQVNDDSIADNFSEGNRPEFMPSLAVDQTTGTVVFTYYDARNDASLTRAANSITVSNDGGLDFSPASYLNTIKNATDFLTGANINIEPIPGNQGAASSFGFGDRQGLAVYGGVITPFFASNQNIAGSTIHTATVTTAAGPRVIANDSGPITAAQSTSTTLPGMGGVFTYDTAVAADGTHGIDGIVVTFDRPVDVASFIASDVLVQYQDPNTGAVAPVILDPTTPITALDEPQSTSTGFGPRSVGFGKLATKFYIKFASAQFKVGTYSYAVGPTVQDDIRLNLTTLNAPVAPNAAGNTDTITVTSNAANAFLAGIPAGPFVIQIDGEQMLVTSATPGGTTWTVVRGYNAAAGSATPPHSINAVVSFSGNQMDQNTVGGIGGVVAAGVNSTKTDSVTGASGPDMFAAPRPLNGIPFQAGYDTQTLPLIIPGPHVISTSVPANDLTWQLQTAIAKTDTSLTVASNFPTAPATPFVVQIDAEQLQISSVSGTTWTIGQRGVNGTQAAAHLANAAIVFAPAISDNLVLNATNNALDVYFDRDIATGTFTAADIISITGPAGPINLGANNQLVKVTQDASDKRLFHITFPTQTLSGSYNIVIAPGVNGAFITDTNGNAVDTNLNAGLDVLRSGTTGAANKSRPVYATPANTSVAIPANGSVSSSITIPDAFPITQSAAQGLFIQVELDIQMKDIRQLQATLTAPDGKTVVHLFGVDTGVFGSSPFADFVGAVFDDSAATPIQSAGTPVTGPFNPQTPLTALNGLSSLGKWTLTLTNNGGPNPGTLSHWELRLPKLTAGSGLGESVADEIQAGFRIFTQASINPQSSTQWTPVGPAGDTQLPANPPNGSSAGGGPVGALALDPSDPSGNTVFAGAVSGGVWKTNNFLTTSAGGPTWVPLTDLGPTNSLNISSIAAYSVNNNPAQTVVFALTGNGQFGLPGVGLLRSTDGGQTWQLLDSLTNVDGAGNVLSVSSNLRQHEFVGSNGFKVIVDPHPYLGNQIAVYVALSGRNGGLYRSLDGGNDWTLLKAGNATDVVLAPGSRDNNGNETVLYAAFAGDGVYITHIATSAPVNSLTRLDGGQLFVTRVNGPNNPIPIGNYNVSPSGANGNIVLALPAVSNNPLADLFYQGWLYAAVANADGTFNGLYLTKDFGDTWTKINLPNLAGPGTNNTGYGTNNETRPTLDPVTNTSAPLPDKQPKGNFDLTLAVDPNNPSVVYLGGSGDQVPLAADGMIRVDLTTLDDPYAMSAYSNNEAAGGVQFNTTGPTSVGASGAAYGILDTLDTPDDSNGTRPDPFDPTDGQPFAAYYNLYRDPINPFVAASTLQFSNVTQFNNSGTDAHWMQVNNVALGGSATQPGSTNQHAILAITDPLTGGTRLLFGDDQGVYTGVDNGKGGLIQTVGTDTVATGSRNGNLQIAQLYAGASQPSTLAANVARALFYASSFDNSYPQSATNVISAGNLKWTGFAGDGDKNGTILPIGRVTGGAGVATDQTGSGQLYQFIYPSTIDSPLTPFDFFQVTPGGQGFPSPRTSTLVQNNDIPGLNQGQWPFYQGSNFAVNPIDPAAIVISSQAGRLFLTDGPDNQGGGGAGRFWNVIANPSDLDGTYASALAFGAPNPVTGAKDDLIYAGTQGGHIYVTVHPGTGQWTDISAGLAATHDPVMQIVTNPKPGSHEAYAVTTTGVYWMKDSSVAGASWVNITGGLFALKRPMFGNTSDAVPTLQFLTSIQADWRYAIPSSTGTHPILYVGGLGGVFRSTDNGTTWTNFPNVANNGASEEGGYLPNVNVTALNLVLGNVDPSTGQPDSSAGLNMLVATTYGRGDFAIRLGSPINIDGGTPASSSPFFQDLVVQLNAPRVIGQAPIVTNSGTTLSGVTLTFAATVDPTLFTSASVKVKGPNGTVKLMPDPYAVVDQNPGTDTIFQVNFAAPQNQTGNYTITVGPNVYDMSGDQMDQDLSPITGKQDNDAGEPEDIYTNTFLYALPTVSTIPNQLVQPGVPDGPIAFTVGDPQYPAGQLTVSVTGDTFPGVVQPSEITFGGSGANRTLTISESAGVRPHGPSTITISVTDPAGYTTTTTFTVTDDNKATLNLTPSPDTVPHGTVSSTIQFNGSDPNGDTVTYGASLADPLFNLKTQYGVVAEHPDYFDFYGANEKWLYAPNAPHLWLLLLPNNTLIAWDGSAHATGALVADLKAAPYSNGSMAVYYNPALLTQTTGTPLASVPGSYLLYDLKQKYGLGSPEDTAAFNEYHGQEKWFHSTNGSNPVGGGWFMILPDNTLVAWDGVVGHAGGSFVADLSPAGYVYGNTSLLPSASVPTVAGVTFTVSNSGIGGPDSGSMVLTPAVGFDRSVLVNVTANDGFFTTTGTDTFTVNDTAPTVPSVGDQVIAHNVGTDSFNLGATDAEGDPLTYKVSISGDNPLYDLQVLYGLNTRDQVQYFNQDGSQEKWLQSSNGSNAAHSGWYILLPDNTLHQWDGTIHATGPVVADFTNTPKYGGASVYADPGLLYAALPPASPVVLTQRGPLYDIQQQYGLTTADIAADFNSEGAQEKWFLSTNGSNAGAGSNFFFLLPNQKLYAWDGTAHATGALIADLSADGDVYHNTALLYKATPAFNTAAYAVAVQFGLTSQEATFVDNHFGLGDKWFYSGNGSNAGAGQGLYYLLSDGTLHAWNGGATNNSPTVATLPTAVYADTTLLTGQALAVTATVSNTGQVTLTPNVAFVGTVRVTASVSDGAETTAQNFLFTVTDLPPTLAAIGPQTGSSASGSKTVTITAGDPNGDALTLAATVSSPLYSLQQEFGLNTADQSAYFNQDGSQEKWLQSSNGSNAAHSGWYILLPNNTLLAWDGSAHATGTVVADFANDPSYGGASVYNTPAFLYSAQPLPSGVNATFPTSGTVKVSWPTTFAGSIWTTVFVSDGAEEVQQSFLTTVS